MDVFIATILLFGFNFNPRGWLLCYGQTLSISQNTAFFSLIGTYYGGNGQTTFQIPNLQGRMAMGQGNGAGLTPHVIGEVAGTETVSILISNLPQHSHIGITGATVTAPASAQLGTTNIPDPTLGMAKLPSIGTGPTAQTIKGYATPDGTTFLKAGTIGGNPVTGPVGNNIPINILNPYLVLNYSIATEGIFPSRN